MKMLTRAAVGLLAAMLCAPAIASDANIGLTIASPAGYIPAGALYCADANGKAAACNFGSGGGGGGTTSLTGTVVSGDQAYTAGSNQPFNLTATGRLKVGLSSAAADGGAAAGFADQIAGIGASDGLQHAFRLDSGLNLKVAVANFPATQPVSGSVTVANASLAVTGTFWQPTQPVSSAQLPAILGATTAAGSLPVALSTDGPVGQKTDAANGATDATAISLIAALKYHSQMLAQLHADMIAATPAGANTIGAVQVTGSSGGVANTGTAAAAGGTSTIGVWGNARGFTFNGATWSLSTKPNTAARITSAAATTNATLVKSSAGDLFDIRAFNTSASPRFLKLYNKASAPTVGTDTPVATYYLPPGAAFSMSLPTPLYFSTGIALAITTGSADSDTGALTAGDIVGLNALYQ